MTNDTKLALLNAAWRMVADLTIDHEIEAANAEKPLNDWQQEAHLARIRLGAAMALLGHAEEQRKQSAQASPAATPTAV